MTLRVTKDLAELLSRTADHTGLTVCEIARAVLNGLRRGRVVLSDFSDCTTESGATVYRFPGVDLPAGVTAGQFRAALAARCREALTRRPVYKFQTSAREGVDYVLED